MKDNDDWKALIRFYRFVITARAQSIREGGGTMEHLSWMLDNMPDTGTEPEKFQRWLGFVQGVLWTSGTYTVDELREQVRLTGDSEQADMLGVMARRSSV